LDNINSQWTEGARLIKAADPYLDSKSIATDSYGGGSYRGKFTEIWVNSWGANDTHVEPQFVEPIFTTPYDRGDYSLTASSPLIDAGYPTGEGHIYDINKNLRTQGTIDVGAYEFNGRPNKYQKLNLVSIPSILEDMSVNHVFPERDGNVWALSTQNNYISVDTLKIGVGYWVNQNEIPIITNGQNINSYIYNAGYPGWIIIGSLSNSINVSSLQTIPPNSIGSSVFRFNRENQYYEPTLEIVPGEGYFVFVNQPCKVILNLSKY
jgi:hypothetical protein